MKPLGFLLCVALLAAFQPGCGVESEDEMASTSAAATLEETIGGTASPPRRCTPAGRQIVCTNELCSKQLLNSLSGGNLGPPLQISLSAASAGQQYYDLAFSVSYEAGRGPQLINRLTGHMVWNPIATGWQKIPVLYSLRVITTMPACGSVLSYETLIDHEPPYWKSPGEQAISEFKPFREIMPGQRVTAIFVIHLPLDPAFWSARLRQYPVYGGLAWAAYNCSDPQLDVACFQNPVELGGIGGSFLIVD